MNVESWWTFYADGSAYGSLIGNWPEAPEGIVMMVLFHESPYRTLLVGESEYTFPDRDEVKHGAPASEELLDRLQLLAANGVQDDPPFAPDSDCVICHGSGTFRDGTYCGCTFRRY